MAAVGRKLLPTDGQVFWTDAQRGSGQAQCGRNYPTKSVTSPPSTQLPACEYPHLETVFLQRGFKVKYVHVIPPENTCTFLLIQKLLSCMERFDETDVLDRIREEEEEATEAVREMRAEGSSRGLRTEGSSQLASLMKEERTLRDELFVCKTWQ
eukprot:26303-Rhodomonas_salina.1